MSFVKRAAQGGILLISAWYAISSLFPPALFAHSGSSNAIDPNMTLTPTTFGKMVIGMSEKDAEKASGLTLERLPGFEDDVCYYLAAKTQDHSVDGTVPPEFSMMMSHDKIVRFDVDTRRFATAKGGRVGMLESDLRGLYGDKLVTEPNPYNSKEHVLTLNPGGDMKNYAEVFETETNEDGLQVVRHMRSGQKPEVSYIEGCN